MKTSFGVFTFRINRTHAAVVIAAARIETAYALNGLSWKYLLYETWAYTQFANTIPNIENKRCIIVITLLTLNVLDRSNNQFLQPPTLVRNTIEEFFDKEFLLCGEDLFF